MTKIRVCNKCGNKVKKSKNKKYSFECNYCDEDLFEFETKLVIIEKYSEYMRNQAIIAVISDLMDIIEENLPELYSSSDVILQADDLIKKLEK
jgi:peptide subunit release factor 1 (eRF1)